MSQPNYRAHRNCTLIMPAHHGSGYLGITHHCWCSSWKVQLDGSMLQCSDQGFKIWSPPKRGQVYLVEREV